MYVENIKLGLLALGVVFALMFIIGIPMFLGIYYLVRFTVRRIRKEW